MINNKTDIQRFEEIVKDNIKRSGIDELMNYLRSTDFYSAPASTKYHNSEFGGLLNHSLNVYDVLSRSAIVKNAGYSNETVAIVSLFHDICKANTTIVSTRNVKNEQTGKWEKVPYYAIDNKYPFGHGEKSVYILMKYIKLTDEEALAINWHMGGFDDRANGYDLSNAFTMSKLALELHIADMRASYILENR